MDAFAVALASSIALGRPTGHQLFRLSFHFGLFQAFMPVIGWFAGRTVAVYVQAWDHWVAFGLLLAIGVKAITESLRFHETASRCGDPTKGLSLVALSVATSIDALAVGLSFAMLEMQIWWPVLIIGIVAGILTLVGMRLGGRLGAKFGGRVGVLGGLILIGIGARILFQHLI